MKTEQLPKIGVVIVASPARVVNMEQQIKNTSEMLKKLEKVEIVQIDKVVTTWQETKTAVLRLKRKDIDLLLLQIGGYAGDEISVRIIKEIDVPLLLWGIPEPLIKGEIKTGSLVGFIQTGGVISKLGRDFKILFGLPGDEKVLKDIRTFSNVVGTIKKLRGSRIGLLGDRCPGMLDESFHELELLRSIGPEIIHIDLSGLISKIKEIDKKRSEDETLKVIEKFGNLSGPTNEDIIEAVKIYLALKDFVNEYSLQAMAVKCWPELMNADIMSPCLALSRLNDEGIMTSCEGDVTAAVSMLILHYLTEKPVFLGDLFEIDEKNNTFFFWHCGAAPSKLADDVSHVNLKMHFRKYKPIEPMVWNPGVIAEFPIKPGRVTFARLTEKKGTYRLLIMQGEAIPTETVISGNCMRVKLDGNVRDVLKNIVSEGIEHHQLLVHEDIREELIELCKFLGIESLLL